MRKFTEGVDEVAQYIEGLTYGQLREMAIELKNDCKNWEVTNLDSDEWWSELIFWWAHNRMIEWRDKRDEE